VCKDGARWMYTAAPIYETTSTGIVGPEVVFYFIVHESGRCMNGTNMHMVADGKAIMRRFRNRQDLAEQHWPDIQEELLSMVYISLFSISLLHCKNVIIKHAEQTHKEKKQREKATGKPGVKFKTLHIEPVTKILRTEGNADENGLQMALHICRGHFKDYRDGNGLFGRHKDIYWWDDHAKGSEEFGTIIKDYSIDRAGA